MTRKLVNRVRLRDALRNGLMSRDLGYILNLGLSVYVWGLGAFISWIWIFGRAYIWKAFGDDYFSFVYSLYVVGIYSFTALLSDVLFLNVLIRFL